MKAMTKIALVTASLLSMGALTACQSTQGPKEEHQGRMMGGHHHDHKKMSPEEREQMKQMRAQHKEMRKQMQNACDGKAIGQAVQVKAGDKTIDGTCNIVFKADRKTKDEMKSRFGQDKDHGRMMRHDGSRMNEMTEEQRAQIQQQFEQKRAERKAQWDAVQKACAGQPADKAIQVKLGDKLLDGKCVVKFQPQFKADGKMPIAAPMPPKA